MTSRGTVMVEALLVLPLFFAMLMLCFKMEWYMGKYHWSQYLLAQFALANIHKQQGAFLQLCAADPLHHCPKIRFQSSSTKFQGKFWYSHGVLSLEK